MKNKLVFSLGLSLILLITISFTIPLIDTPSPVLAQEDHGDNGGDNGGDDGGDDGGDNGGHDGGDDGGDDGGHDGGDDGHHDGDHGDNNGAPEQEALPGGEILGDMQPIESPDGIPIVDAEGNLVWGQLVKDKNGKTILGPNGYPMYYWQGRLVSPVPG